jgi:hypothetical protein
MLLLWVWSTSMAYTISPFKYKGCGLWAQIIFMQKFRIKLIRTKNSFFYNFKYVFKVKMLHMFATIYFASMFVFQIGKMIRSRTLLLSQIPNSEHVFFYFDIAFLALKNHYKLNYHLCSLLLTYFK